MLPVRLPLLLLAFLAGVSPLAAQEEMAPLVRIISPNECETYPYATVKRRVLQWNDERKEMYALITMSTGRYAGPMERKEEETLRFQLPGLQYDKEQGLYFVADREGNRIPFAHDKRVMLVSTIEPVNNAVVRIRRIRGNVNVYADIYPAAEVIQAERDRMAALADKDTHELDVELPGGIKLSEAISPKEGGQGGNPHQTRFGNVNDD